MFCEKFTIIRHCRFRMFFSYAKMELSAAEIWDSLLVATQRKGGWAGPI